jgi:hypothetical protein
MTLDIFALLSYATVISSHSLDEFHTNSVGMFGLTYLQLNVLIIATCSLRLIQLLQVSCFRFKWACHYIYIYIYIYISYKRLEKQDHYLFSSRSLELLNLNFIRLLVFLLAVQITYVIIFVDCFL